MNFEVGQRWLSEAEPELGLGIIFELGHKSLKVSFPAKQEFRVYGRDKKKCKRLSCFGTINKITQSNRSTFFCEICQK